MTATQSTNEPTIETDPGIQPADVLLTAVISRLTPLFLTASAGDHSLARRAALDAITTHNPRNSADLLTIAQLIGFSFATLDSLARSMPDTLSDTRATRLRGSAAACNRAAQQQHRALQRAQRTAPPAASPPARRPAIPPQETKPTPAPEATRPEATSEATAEATSETPAEATAETPADTTSATPGETPAATQTKTPAHAPSATLPRPTRLQAAWADAMTTVAAEFTAGLPHAAPRQRQAMSLRAAILNSCASDLLCGTIPAAPPAAPPPIPGL